VLRQPGCDSFTENSLTIRGDRPIRFAGQRLVCAYEETPSGRIPDASPGYGYHLTEYGRQRRANRAVHDALWAVPEDTPNSCTLGATTQKPPFESPANAGKAVLARLEVAIGDRTERLLPKVHPAGDL
jgi:hypothetical protein